MRTSIAGCGADDRQHDDDGDVAHRGTGRPARDRGGAGDRQGEDDQEQHRQGQREEAGPPAAEARAQIVTELMPRQAAVEPCRMRWRSAAADSEGSYRLASFRVWVNKR